jgi:surface antigen
MATSPFTRTRRSAVIATAALAALGAAAPASARPICDEYGGPCPPPQQDRERGTATGTVNVAKGWSLSVRARPNGNSRKVRSVADGAQVKIVCQTRGQRVDGRYGSTRVWDKLAGGGFVSDAYVYTGSDRRVARDCRTRKRAPKQHNGGGRPASIQLRNDYPFKSGSWNDADPWAFFKRECTSFVAYRLNRVMQFHNHMRGGHFSDAANWDDNARRIGFRVDRRPTVGSVMVRNSGTYGHVAMVAKARRNRVFVEQYNAGGTHQYSKEWLRITPEMTFIHFKR